MIQEAKLQRSWSNLRHRECDAGKVEIETEINGYLKVTKAYSMAPCELHSGPFPPKNYHANGF